MNRVDNKGRLYLNFTNDWNTYSPNCSVVAGFTQIADNSPIICRLIDNTNSYLVENFAYISSEMRLIIEI